MQQVVEQVVGNAPAHAVGLRGRELVGGMVVLCSKRWSKWCWSAGGTRYASACCWPEGRRLGERQKGCTTMLHSRALAAQLRQFCAQMRMHPLCKLLPCIMSSSSLGPVHPAALPTGSVERISAFSDVEGHLREEVRGLLSRTLAGGARAVRRCAGCRVFLTA